MSWRKSLATFLILAAVSPAWGAAEPLGSVISTSESNVRNTNLTAGATVYNGDVISVAQNGTTQIALSDGTHAEILGSSSVRLAKIDDTIQLIVDRGQASFRTSGDHGIGALVGDVTVRPLDGAETSAIIQSLSKTHAVIAAQKGALLVTTAFDNKTYTLNEGQAADLSSPPDPNQTSATPQPSGQTSSPRLRRKGVIWVVIIGGSATAVTAYLLARREKTPSTTILQNEVSPSKPN